MVATVGTANLDFRSLYLNYECGACFYESKMIADVKNDILNLQNDCHEVSIADCKTNFLVKFLQSICRMFAPIM